MKQYLFFLIYEMILKHDYDFLFSYLKSYINEQDRYHNNNSEHIKGIMREFLQTLVLSIIYQSKANIYFMGGTNMRICYKLDRFSEDLDFATLVPDKQFDIHKLEEDLLNALSKAGFDIEITPIESKTNVKKCFVKFGNIISQFFGNKTKEKISIKLEIDVNPPLGAQTEKYVLQNPLFTFILLHHDLGTTFTGKIGAILMREYNKGRDFYDMLRYLQNVGPETAINLVYLNNRAQQSNHKGFNNEQDVGDALQKKIENISSSDWGKISSDIQRFVFWDKEMLDIYIANYPTNFSLALKRYLASKK